MPRLKRQPHTRRGADVTPAEWSHMLDEPVTPDTAVERWAIGGDAYAFRDEMAGRPCAS